MDMNIKIILFTIILLSSGYISAATLSTSTLNAGDNLNYDKLCSVINTGEKPIVIKDIHIITIWPYPENYVQVGSYAFENGEISLHYLMALNYIVPNSGGTFYCEFIIDGGKTTDIRANAQVLDGSATISSSDAR